MRPGRRMAVANPRPLVAPVMRTAFPIIDICLCLLREFAILLLKLPRLEIEHARIECAARTTSPARLGFRSGAAIRSPPRSRWV
jgi:hypothetical protein